jgi:exodeoxyribonuclease-3
MTKVKIVTFNVNSINARLPRFLEWLKNSAPDIILLQELKCLEEKFPLEAISDAGYNVAILGQKTYNGVAILSKFRIEEVVKTLPNFEDEQARYIEALISVEGKIIRVSSAYIPNGGGDLAEGEKLEESKKFLYKLRFFDALKAHYKNLIKEDEIQIFGGDFNVAQEEVDVFDPKSWSETVCFHSLERQKFRSILNLGLTDSYRAFNPNAQGFSWYDYRGGAWQNGKGLRIDYLLTSPKASDKVVSATIEDKGVRDQEKASDHCPCTVEIEI